MAVIGVAQADGHDDSFVVRDAHDLVDVVRVFDVFASDDGVDAAVLGCQHEALPKGAHIVDAPRRSVLVHRQVGDDRGFEEFDLARRELADGLSRFAYCNVDLPGLGVGPGRSPLGVADDILEDISFDGLFTEICGTPSALRLP